SVRTVPVPAPTPMTGSLARRPAALSDVRRAAMPAAAVGVLRAPAALAGLCRLVGADTSAAAPPPLRRKARIVPSALRRRLTPPPPRRWPDSDWRDPLGAPDVRGAGGGATESAEPAVVLPVPAESDRTVGAPLVLAASTDGAAGADDEPPRDALLMLRCAAA